MGINRRNVDAAANIVRNALSLKVPISLSGLCTVIDEKLSGKCIPDVKLSIDAEIRTNNEYPFFEVRYRVDKPETRILFSVAHELGHLFLHLLEQDGKLKKAEVLQRNNEFAAAFLMPEEEFVEKCQEHLDENRINVTKVAKDFNVSVQAATVRGNVLGLW